MKKVVPDCVLRPGPEGWEFWKYPLKGDPYKELDVSAKSLASSPHLVLALPTRSLLVVPLWISPHGKPSELAELELSSRHLLRKGAEVTGIPIFEENGRSLIMAIASVDDEVAVEFFPKAKSFEFPARLIDPAESDVVIWREWGNLCFALYRDSHCVFFGATGDKVPSPGFCSMIVRTTMRLRSEGIVTRAPVKMRLIGDFSFEDRSTLGDVLHADWDHLKEMPAPILHSDNTNPAPPAAKAAMLQRERMRRLSTVAAGVVALYAFVLLCITVDLVVRRVQLNQINAKVEALAQPAEAAQRLVTEWKEFRFAVDPTAFALDQLGAVAAEIPGEKVRLTQYVTDNGRLTIAGEAADVSQAYEFIERVKKSALLQDYDWISRQPQLVGRNKVRFEMEGTRPDAKTSEE